MDAGELVRQIVLREHDLCDFSEVFRLVFTHPEELRGSKAREGDVRRQSRELVLADGIVEIVDLLKRASVIPQNRRADDVIGCIQRDKAVHLAARADADDIVCVKALQKLRNTGRDRVPPVLGPLLRPAGVREAEGVFLCHSVQNIAVFCNKQQLARRRAEIDADKIHVHSPLNHEKTHRAHSGAKPLFRLPEQRPHCESGDIPPAETAGLSVCLFCRFRQICVDCRSDFCTGGVLRCAHGLRVGQNSLRICPCSVLLCPVGNRCIGGQPSTATPCREA